MEGTLESGDCVFASVRYGKPEQGDIVIINDYAAVLLEDGEPVETEGLDKYIVKRVIATEGQTVDIDFERGAVYVDGEMLDETYITGLTHLDEGAFTGEYPVVVPENCCFVMGDNRGVSKDSRSSDVGFVPERCIEAKVFFRLSPYDKIGFID
jgi:signal peptidase I